MNTDREITQIPPPVYTPQPPRSPKQAETTHPSEPVLLATLNPVTEKLPFRKTRKTYQLPITLIQRTSLPSYETSTQPSLSTAPTDPPAYSPPAYSATPTPTTPPLDLEQITEQSITNTLLSLPSSSPGYLAPLPYGTLLYHIQGVLESLRVVPLTADLICQCEIYFWISAPAPAPALRGLRPEMGRLGGYAGKARGSLERVVDRREILYRQLIQQGRNANASKARHPIQTDLSERIGQNIWDPEDGGRRVLEGCIREGRVCGFEVYWWVRG
ncbi:hypothetical protein BDV97DRAFT_78135 [Delphinella strobiligena]|nr:hypothetical protein BDV97DRAFT_78135 [Delphinella strobiligena]